MPDYLITWIHLIAATTLIGGLVFVQFVLNPSAHQGPPDPKTKEMVSIVNNLVDGESVLLLLAESDENVEKSARNLTAVKTLKAHYLNIRDLLGYHKVVMPLSALEAIEGFLGLENGDIQASDMDEEE